MKKKVLHVIDSLRIGGAETLLAYSVSRLTKFENIIITLENDNFFNEKLINIEIISLGFKGKKWEIPVLILKLKRIIKENNIDIVHSHLFLSTIVSRLSTPKNVKLFSTYHSLLYETNNTSQFSKKMLFIDKFTYKKRHHLIFISEEVQRSISTALCLKEKGQIIYNFVDDEYFKKPFPVLNGREPFRIVSVGNFRPEKNFLRLVEAVGRFTADKLTLDLFGDGRQRKEIEKLLLKNKIKNVNLKGRVRNLNELLSVYDTFISPSIFEGFGIALVESMALGLPCIVSNIPIFFEITEGKLSSFNPDNVDSIVESISLQMKLSQPKLIESGKLGRQLAKKYTLDNYIENLNNAYTK